LRRRWARGVGFWVLFGCSRLLLALRELYQLGYRIIFIEDAALRPVLL